MKTVLFAIISCCVLYSKALDCGISKVGSDQFKKVITDCVKDNQTLNKIWELASTISSEEDDDKSVSSDEEVPISKGLASNVNNRNAKTSRFGRSKRSRNSKNYNNDSPMSGMQRKYGSAGTTTTVESTSVEEQGEENIRTNNVGESEDSCILQCIFEKLELTDSNGLPDHKKFAAALVKTTNGRENKDFLQETADECFQQLQQDDSENPCDFSTKLMTCLAEKGKANCEDWPIGNLPF